MLEGTLVRLRPVTEEDYPLIAKWWNDFRIQQWYDRAKTPQTVADVRRIYDSPTSQAVRFMIETKIDRIPIGTFDFYNIHPIYKYCWFGIMLDPDFWRGGYGSDAMRVVLDYGFYELKLHKVTGRTVARNIGALKCFEKFGFRHKGIYERHIFWHDKWWDLVHSELFREEYLRRFCKKDLPTDEPDIPNNLVDSVVETVEKVCQLIRNE